jgi:hypothetical protein
MFYNISSKAIKVSVSLSILAMFHSLLASSLPKLLVSNPKNSLTSVLIQNSTCSVLVIVVCSIFGVFHSVNIMQGNHPVIVAVLRKRASDVRTE